MTFQYFRDLHRLGWKRWKVERMFHAKPWYIPRWLWIDLMHQAMLIQWESAFIDTLVRWFRLEDYRGMVRRYPVGR